MAKTYNEIVKIREGKANYNIAEEKSTEWSSFLPNAQFNEVLCTVLKSVRANDIDNHKSFWIDGTYGTGKSHAASVISHLLCDEIEDIRHWVDYEYSYDKYKLLRSEIYDVRKNKRLLPVKIYGLEKMTQANDVAPILQQNVLKALKKYGIDVCVSTDFATYIKHINNNPDIWDILLTAEPKLSAIAGNREQLVKKLQGNDLATFHRATDALSNRGLSIRLDIDKIGQWLVEVQNGLRQQGTYNGLLILWDEFTEVMNDSIGLQVLNKLQEIAEVFENTDNDSYLFLISHPSAFDGLNDDQKSKTNGRYHRMKYNMEPVSAFKIMSRKFEIVNKELHREKCQQFYGNYPNLLDLFVQGSNDPSSSSEDLYNLYPLHPGTANLATYYATTVGSSSRSVFEFLGQNEAIKDFLTNEAFYSNNDTITADYLWDYVLKVFQDDVVKYGVVTERYNSYHKQVTAAGEAYLAIFKGVLLLNAFNNIAGSDLVTPSETNIHHLFVGSRYDENVDEVLRWLNDESIIQRTPGEAGLYSVIFSALPTSEVEKHKGEMRDVQFKYTHQLFNFAPGTSESPLISLCSRIIRPYETKSFSEEENDTILKNKIKKGRKLVSGSKLFIAFLVSRNNNELDHLRTFAQGCANNKDDEGLKNIIFVVCDRVLGDDKYNQFIDYQANAACASSHNISEQEKTYTNNAMTIVADWHRAISRENATIYLNGIEEPQPLSVTNLAKSVNAAISPFIFPYAPDAYALLRTKASMTFWNVQNSRDIVRKLLSIKSIDELSNLNAQAQPIRYLFQDCVENNLEWKSDTQEHPLRKIFDEVNGIIKSASGEDATFNLDEKFANLAKPPYGLYKSYACMGAMAFAFRPWINKIFDTQGKPLDVNALTESIASLFDVWWEPQKAKKNLSFKFQTPEETTLCKELIDIFNLKGQDNADISSLTATRYAIVSDFLAMKNAPLWTIKYAPDLTMGAIKIAITDKIKTLVDDIVNICGNSDSRNKALFEETIQLISELRIDIKNILNQDSIFTEGFKGYLMRLEKIDIKEEEIEDVLQYIKAHLEDSVGYWTEEQVEKQALYWMADKQKKNTSDIAPATKPTSSSPNATSNPNADAIKEKHRQAVERVTKIDSLAEAKEILMKLCETGDENTINLIIGLQYV